MPVIINGTTGIDTVQDGIVTDAKLSLTANSQEIKDALNASGSAPIYACRAWVNFNGTGTVAIRASGNVSSITDNATGDYTVNFATAFPDESYSIVGTGSDSGAWGSLFHTAANSAGGGTNPTTTSSRVLLSNNATTSRVDDGFINVAVFR